MVVNEKDFHFFKNKGNLMKPRMKKKKVIITEPKKVTLIWY